VIAATGRSWRDPIVLGLLLALAFGLWELQFSSFMADDFIQLGVLEGVLPVNWLGPLNLYTISDGNAQHVQLLKDAGALPWFFDPGFKMAFFRPLSSAALVLDHTLFGLNPIGYRIHGVLWSLLLVVGVGELYSLVLQRAGLADGQVAVSQAGPIATLALLLFTIAGIHGFFCWTATRHIVIAAAVGVLALCSHVRWREQSWRPGRLLSVLGFVVALSASEAALGMIAYLLAYEALGARGDGWSRVRASVPVIGVLGAYLLMYRVLGLGTSGGSDYLDPFNDPMMYVTQIPGRLVFLIGAMLSGANADLWLLRPGLRPAMILAAALVILLCGVLLRTVWVTCSAREQRATGWMLAGALLSAIPFAGSAIGSRCVLVPWIGGSVAIALMLNRWWTTLRRRPGLSNRLLGTLCWGLVGIHLVLAPVQRLAVPYLLQRVLFRDLARAVGDPHLGGEEVTERTVVLLNAPDLRLGLHAYLFRQLYRLPIPAAWRVLSWAPCAHRFRRTAVDIMDMELVGGELHASSLVQGEVINVAGMQATVTELGRDGPTRVRFRFDKPLDDPSLVWLIWKDGRLQRIAPPAIGATLDLPWEPGNSL